MGSPETTDGRGFAEESDGTVTPHDPLAASLSRLSDVLLSQQTHDELLATVVDLARSALRVGDQTLGA